jgi:hypothetical protein
MNECERCSKNIKKVFKENQKKLKNEKQRWGKRVRRYRVGTSVVEIPITKILTPSQPVIHFLLSWFSSQNYGCINRNSAQLKKPVD